MCSYEKKKKKCMLRTNGFSKELTSMKFSTQFLNVKCTWSWKKFSKEAKIQILDFTFFFFFKSSINSSWLAWPLLFLDLENSLNFAYQQIECDIHHLLNDMYKSQLYILHMIHSIIHVHNNINFNFLCFIFFLISKRTDRTGWMGLDTFWLEFVVVPNFSC